jgi:imidazolonepropionase
VGATLRLTGIRELLTFEPGLARSENEPQTLGLIRDATLEIDGQGRIARIARADEAGAAPEGTREIDLGGAVVLPGLLDCHTHLVYAGVRTVDFSARTEGLSYEEVARRGGGIRTTVAATRAATVGELLVGTRARLAELARHGVTTVEIKTGYGLEVEQEIRLLEVIGRLREEGPLRVEPTLLALHALPDRFRNDREGYLRQVLEELLPEAARRRLARFVDVFCDEGAFRVDESLAVLERARDLGFLLKAHAEQLTHTGIARRAAELGATSVDHLEAIAPEDIPFLRDAGTTAVLLPGAAIYLGGRARAPARALLDGGVSVALSTDSNPGSCPTTHLPLQATLGCTWLGMRPEEALLGLTRSAARALALGDGRGRLAPGAPADLAISRLASWREIPYWLAGVPFHETWVGGRRVSAASQHVRFHK